MAHAGQMVLLGNASGEMMAEGFYPKSPGDAQFPGVEPVKLSKLYKSENKEGFQNLGAFFASLAKG